MNTQRATNKDMPTANFFETDFSIKLSKSVISKITLALFDFSKHLAIK